MNDRAISRSAVSLSVLTAVLGRCILSGAGAVSARQLLLQGLPMAAALGLISALLTAAEGENDSFSGHGMRSRLVCLLGAVWFGAELLETVAQAQKISWEQFSSMAVIGILPLLLWAGIRLEPAVFSRSAGILWWAAGLAVLAWCFGLRGQFHWEQVVRYPAAAGELRFPLYAEFFLLPFLPGGRRSPKHFLLPVQVLLGKAAFAFGMEALLGAASRNWTVALHISRWDAAALLVWLACAMFRICLLGSILRQLLAKVFCGREEEVPE